MDRWSEKLLDGNAISAVVSTNDNVIVLDEYGSEEGYRIQMAAEPDGTYNAIAPVYGNERASAPYRWNYCLSFSHAFQYKGKSFCRGVRFLRNLAQCAFGKIARFFV